MSGFLAIWHLDGRPVDPTILLRLTDLMACRGPDGTGCWTEDSVGLGHRRLVTTPESLHESQPFADESGRLRLVLDGRIDNRDEVLRLLGDRGPTPRADHDAELVLRAYEYWGAAAPERLVGEYAFALWDGRARCLFCARDHQGTKPLYYFHLPGRLFLCASALGPILDHPAVSPAPHEGIIGEYLANSLTSLEDTLYRNVLRLPAAHYLTIEEGRLRKARYWEMEPASDLRHDTDEAYAEHFFSLFAEAVRVRLRSHGPVGFDLSGGLDSSSVVASAQWLVQSGQVPNPGLEPFSLIFPGRDCDESPYIDAVLARWRAAGCRVSPFPPTLARVLAGIRGHRDFPAYPNSMMFDHLRAAAKARDICVMLTGTGGDDWLGEGFSPYADLLREGRLLALWREARRDLPRLGPLGFLRELLSPMLPDPVRSAYVWARRGHGLPSWIRPEFARRIALPDRLRAGPAPRRYTSYAQRDLLLGGLSGEQVHHVEMDDRECAADGIECRHPFNDRRVMEFVLALPPEQRYRDATTKVILRRALGDRLPALVRERPDKAEFSHSFSDAFQALGGAALFDRLLSDSYWLDVGEAQRLYRRMADLHQRGDEAYKPLVWPLWRILGVGLWHIELFGPGRIGEAFGADAATSGSREGSTSRKESVLAQPR